MTAFVDFGKKSVYSLKNAFGNVTSIMPTLKEREQKYYTVSDYGEVGIWPSLYFDCKKNDIVPILGMQTFVNDYRYRLEEEKYIIKKMSSDEEWEKSEDVVSDDEKDWSQIDFPLNIFARTVDGYYNIIKIHNDAQINGVANRPRTTDAFLKTHGNGVVATLPTPYSKVSSLVYNGLIRKALVEYERYKRIFDDVYIEVPILEDEDYREINKEIISFCKQNNIKMIPVINSHYDVPEDEESFPVFQKCGRLRGGFTYEVDYAPNMSYKTAEEVWDTFKKYHESDVFDENTMRMMLFELNSLCSKFKTLDIDTSPKMPKFKDSDKQLREHAFNGLRKKELDGKKEYIDRLEYELDNIIRAGFADYFIMLEDLFRWHREVKGRLSSVGRGSAAGSLVLYTIGVTKVDPLQHNLLFERFLDASRLDDIINKGGKVSGSDFPDVDCDFESNAKESVKEYFAEKYGNECTCSIGTIGYLRTKSVLKELGRVHDVVPDIINQLTTVGLKNFEPSDEEMTLQELREKFPALNSFLEDNTVFCRDFSKLHGTINCWGVHAGGVLISDSPLIDVLPVRVNDGKLCSVWTEGLKSRELGQMGFIKLDILAIETLDVIEEAIQLINQRHGTDIDFDSIPLNDERSLDRINNKENIGVFQFETPLSLRVAKNMGGIKRFDDLASLSTLMRPAALENKFDVKFGEYRYGMEHPEEEGVKKPYMPNFMKPYMEKEYGLPIYQEAAYFFAKHMAGFDNVSAFKFMKLLYKNKMTKDIQPEWRKKFMEGCKNKQLGKHND